MINKTPLTILVSIILTILIVSLVNIGLSIFLPAPDYNVYCGNYRQATPVTKPLMPNEPYNYTIVCANDTKTCKDGTIVSEDPINNCEFPPCSREFKYCSEELDYDMKAYNQIKFYIFASIGFILLLIGLFAAFNMFQLTGLFSGAILLTEGIVMNFKNKVIVFVSLLIILVIFGLAAWRILDKLNKKDKDKDRDTGKKR